MALRLSPETESRLQELSATTGRSPEELVEDVMAGYFAELNELRDTLSKRYEDIESGRVQPIDGAEAFRILRERAQKHRSR